MEWLKMDLHICNKNYTRQLSSGNLGLYIGYATSQSCVDNSRGIADHQRQLGGCPNSIWQLSSGNLGLYLMKNNLSR